MSKRSELPAILSVGIVLLLVCHQPVLADVTGKFGTHISLRPQSTISEIELIDFDVQNDLSVTTVVSGLIATFHTHFGIAGVEDVILDYATALGVLDLSGQLVFARFPAGSFVPRSELRFLQKSTWISLVIGGVGFSSHAIFEDTGWPQTPAFAFGDVIKISGTTPSGVEISGQTAICLDPIPNKIKKHRIGDYAVNPHCATEPKPDMLFDFEDLSIKGIPIAADVFGDFYLHCLRVQRCQLNGDLTFSGIFPFPFTVRFQMLDLLMLSEAEILLRSGAGTMVLGILNTGSAGTTTVSIVSTLFPDTTPVRFGMVGIMNHGFGFEAGTLQIIIERENLIFGGTLLFGGGPNVELQGAIFELGAQSPRFRLETIATFLVDGLLNAEMWFDIKF